MAEHHISKFACHACRRPTFILQRNSVYILLKFTRYNTLQEIQYDTYIHLHPTAETSRTNTTFTTRTRTNTSDIQRTLSENYILLAV